MPAARCPHCSQLQTAATHYDGKPEKPSPGDWSVCPGCGGLLTFAADMTLVAGLAFDLAREPVETRALIARMQLIVRERNRQE
jgi:hypothetical protein